MKRHDSLPATSSIRAARAHGEATRRHILEVAGALFAEHGYDATTSKHICAEARVNLASVNYHFGGREGLYTAVLAQARLRLPSLEALNAIAAGGADARGKLGQVIDDLVGAMGSDGWHLRVFLRELVSPPAAFDTPPLAELEPKLAIVKALLAEAAGLAADDARLPRCLLSTFGPCVMLLIANRTALRHVMSDFRQDPAALARHLKTFAFAGLDAVARQERNE